ncbi:uncharacterized protein LOC129939677 isoform X2 [Eupeodes corollae]|uniref:uncharacterized protein LOC129939677 isoform X2 n=1 Tax=Eupeodes corollae TaxID=290404 RepID=UPI00248F5A7B|nr:uncharacterized protein LOC129939677 isoform X2 [Eupeodes corollae]
MKFQTNFDCYKEFKIEDKIVIPEQIAIQLINSSEISAEQFYKNLHEYYQRHHIQYLWNKDGTHQNLQNAPLNKTPKQNDFAQQQKEVPRSLAGHRPALNNYQFTEREEANEVALLESLTIASQEIHSATAPPINEKPSNYDDEDYSEDDSNLGAESSGFFPFNFEYTNRRKFDAD